MTMQSVESDRWRVMSILPHYEPLFMHVAGHLVAAKDRYIQVTARTTVPWFVIAVIHEREASQSWTANLAQGDPWNKVSIHIPSGRGPFTSWEDAACDALNNCPPYIADEQDWSIGGILLALEQYNGMGYVKRHMASPYLWAGTDQYSKGKYVADGHFDPNAVDHQLGCAGLLKAMMQLDGTRDLSCRITRSQV